VAFDEFDDEIDRELARAFAGTSAPPRLRVSVINRIRMPAPTRLPEYLDAIAIMSVLSFAAGFAFFVILK
jgi:hypothetical protein